MSDKYFKHERSCPVYGDMPRDDTPCKCIDQRLTLFMREWETQGHEGSDLCADEVLAVCATFFKAGQDALTEEVEKLKEEKLRIIRGDFGQICSYCGEGNDTGLTWEELQSHIRACVCWPNNKHSGCYQSPQGQGGNRR